MAGYRGGYPGPDSASMSRTGPAPGYGPTVGQFSGPGPEVGGGAYRHQHHHQQHYQQTSVHEYSDQRYQVPQPTQEIQLEPEYYERLVEVPKVHVENVERIIEVPQPQIVDRIIEIPQVQEIVRELPGDIEIQVITREVPKIEVRQVERIVEVPQIEYEDRYVEVEEVREVVRRIPRVEVKEIPVERIIRVPKKIIQEIEQPVYRPVPHLVRQKVEREIPIPRTQVQTMEVVRQVAMPTPQDRAMGGPPPEHHRQGLAGELRPHYADAAPPPLPPPTLPQQHEQQEQNETQPQPQQQQQQQPPLHPQPQLLPPAPEAPQTQPQQWTSQGPPPSQPSLPPSNYQSGKAQPDQPVGAFYQQYHQVGAAVANESQAATISSASLFNRPTVMSGVSPPTTSAGNVAFGGAIAEPMSSITTVVAPPVYVSSAGNSAQVQAASGTYSGAGTPPTPPHSRILSSHAAQTSGQTAPMFSQPVPASIASMSSIPQTAQATTMMSQPPVYYQSGAMTGAYSGAQAPTEPGGSCRTLQVGSVPPQQGRNPFASTNSVPPASTGATAMFASQASQNPFDVADKNHDGFLSREEFSQAFGGQQAEALGSQGTIASPVASSVLHNNDGPPAEPIGSMNYSSSMQAPVTTVSMAPPGSMFAMVAPGQPTSQYHMQPRPSTSHPQPQLPQRWPGGSGGGSASLHSTGASMHSGIIVPSGQLQQRQPPPQLHSQPQVRTLPPQSQPQLQSQQQQFRNDPPTPPSALRPASAGVLTAAAPQPVR
mmetsp:Transcript_2543/g.6046  ORF Transcript_2543/g.6046 Transcript_2543/m.6046 type:complete len:766 (-) Transcript_2543:396-2693(-)|eukprot:CAMPEP_0206453850 /NCGR_PEP_ID=MMETSP0324_2-20121206/20794_1 /ASSEMBLY_ACC=CAM_ASM_000836 /TAXON_ID=2866 /ORGANISM="Crypthecodinium cohnii, Strain Seligo" /LENGTH=765 /DNA_ID=CAMNT_0053924225 /DNA_START=61 /DNA_END=2358 /DNA_ORIENTATION=-